MKKYTFINAMVLSAALSGNVWADLDDGLVAYYPFNGNAKDESGNGNDGTVNGDVNYVYGKIGQAASFSGNQYVSLSSDRFLDNYCHITIISWFNYQASDANYHQIIAIGDTRGGLDPISFQFQKQKLHNFGFENVINKKAIKLNINSKNPLIENNVWNFLAVTLEELENGSKLTVIINDEIIQEITTSEKVCIRYDTNMETQIGAIHAQQNWIGFIDDIRIYNRALSESEIQQLYATTLETNISPKDSGTITKSPEKTSYSPNEEVTLTAKPAKGYKFKQWQGDASGSDDTITIKMNGNQNVTAVFEEKKKQITSKATYDLRTKTLFLKGILVPFLDGFSREETGEKGIFNVQLQEKVKDAFELIPWSINLKGMFEGEDTSGYILYDHESRSVYIPCFKVATIADIGDGIEGKATFYKDVTMKQWNKSYPIFHIKDMTKADSCK